MSVNTLIAVVAVLLLIVSVILLLLRLVPWEPLGVARPHELAIGVLGRVFRVRCAPVDGGWGSGEPSATPERHRALPHRLIHRTSHLACSPRFDENAGR
jgi:hypothetical protein